MITRAYIQKYDSGESEPEHKDVFATLVARGVDCKWITMRQILPGQLDFSSETFYAGDHDFMQAIFKKAGILYAKRSSYPESLRNFLKRTIWSNTILEVNQLSANFEPFFIKPETDAKLFTGFVLYNSRGLYKLQGLPRNTNLHCSEFVHWKSEFRIFVNAGKIVGIAHYSGDEKCSINLQLVEEAIVSLEESPENTAACALDFGVLENGDTALVEWNDAFSLGSYQLDPEMYTDLLISRWEELLDGI